MANTNMIDQYLQVKEQYKDCILFYRLGDFYEMFFEDAVKASAMLELVLTSKNGGYEDKIPMCGIPYHAAETYISKLVSLGEKVAICEQMTPPGKGLVKREVVRVVTAGTVTNNEFLDEKSNNFLVCVCFDQDSAAVSWADITTGEFYVKSFNGDNLFSDVTDYLFKLSPAEIIANKKAISLFNDAPVVGRGLLPKFCEFLESEFNLGNAENTLKKQFGVLNLNSFDFGDDVSVSCAGALIAYLKETQMRTVAIIDDVKIIRDGDALLIDGNAIRNLELTKTLRDGKRYGSLLWLLDKTKTNMGARKLQSWVISPLCDKDKINYRLYGVKAFFDNNLIRQGLIDILSSVKDISRIAGKLSNGILSPRDCMALSGSLNNLPSVKFQLTGIPAKIISDIIDDIKDFGDIVALLDSAIEKENCPPTAKDGEFIKNGYSEELDKYRELKKNGENLLLDLENRERERTGIKNLKIKYNRVFGYSFEVTNSFKDLIPYDFERRQTLANAERFVTAELKQLESDILSSGEKALNLELKLFNEIKETLSARIDDLKTTSDALATLDVLLCLSRVAKENDYVMPQIMDKGAQLSITAGRHPVVEKIIKQRFVPNDVLLDNGENRTMIITGPNMAGKSTYMRQVALIVLMAHIGSFVPAEKAEIPLTDKIFTRIGASDNLISDQSTFMVEMSEVATIINNATEDSLLVLDEIGRGTSTFDGLSIAWAVVEYLTNHVKAKTMFATHYHELTELEGKLDGVKNYKIAVKELNNGIAFIRKIMRGGANKSFGIEVAELAGVKKELTSRAKQILKELEKRDIAKYNTSVEAAATSDCPALSETEKIIKDLDINSLSPIQAFNILIDLAEKIKGEL